MYIDLVHRCYFQKSKGDTTNFDRLSLWLEEAKEIPGNEFEVNNMRFEWKVINADKLNDIINDDYTEWVFLRAIDNSFVAIGERRIPETDNAGLPKSVTFSTMWIFKSNIEKLEVTNRPINIWSPHIFESPLHRTDYDFKVLVSRLYNPKVSITRFVEYKEFKTDRIKIR